MQAFLSLTRRELAGFFVSFIGYVVIALAVFLMGLSFVSLVNGLQGESTPFPVTEVFYKSLYFWVILLFSTPVITMRTFSQEKFSGTFETLMTAPVSDAQVVLAKFTATLIIHLIMWLPLFGFIFALRYFTNDSTFIDGPALGSTFLGIFLLGTLYMAIGCFASALTSSQLVAAMVSFAIGIALFMLGWLTESFPLHQTWLSEMLKYSSMHVHMADFARGIIDSRYVVYYLTLSFFFLFLTYRVVESRRWK